MKLCAASSFPFYEVHSKAVVSRFVGVPFFFYGGYGVKEKIKYPQCPFCGKVRTLCKQGKLYVCQACRRVTLKFNWR